MENHDHFGIILVAGVALALGVGLFISMLIVNIGNLDDMRDRISILEGTPVAEEQER